MPVIGNEDEVVVAIGRAAAWHQPGRLQGCFAQRGAPTDRQRSRHSEPERNLWQALQQPAKDALEAPV